MKFLLVVTIMVLLSASICAAPYDFPWKTTRAEIEKVHRLDIFELEPLQKNLNKFLGEDDGAKFTLCLVDSMAQRRFCDIGMFSVMGFYADSLVFYFLATEEMPYSKDRLENDCLMKAVFGDDSLKQWKPIFKTSAEDGDIFWEGAMCGVGESENEYLVSLNSLGQKGIMNPEHIQYTDFFFDKEFLDEIFAEKMKIHPDQKARLHPTSLFVQYLVDDYKSLQKPPKKK